MDSAAPHLESLSEIAMVTQSAVAQLRRMHDPDHQKPQRCECDCLDGFQYFFLLMLSPLVLAGLDQFLKEQIEFWCSPPGWCVLTLMLVAMAAAVWVKLRKR